MKVTTGRLFMIASMNKMRVILGPDHYIRGAGSGWDPSAIPADAGNRDGFRVKRVMTNVMELVSLYINTHFTGLL
jgi:hypothetical protein